VFAFSCESRKTTLKTCFHSRSRRGSPNRCEKLSHLAGRIDENIDGGMKSLKVIAMSFSKIKHVAMSIAAHCSHAHRQGKKIQDRNYNYLREE
jgi:hypothetical protein